MRGQERGEMPLWRQAAEGIGMVGILTLLICLAGFALSLVVALIF